jgi:hypothetical protein
LTVTSKFHWQFLFPFLSTTVRRRKKEVFQARAVYKTMIAWNMQKLIFLCSFQTNFADALNPPFLKPKIHQICYITPMYGDGRSGTGKALMFPCRPADFGVSDLSLLELNSLAQKNTF